MKNNYYFYVNFPNFASKTILIHKGTCGHCNQGLGKNGIGSNERGFWAGPFGQYDNARAALTNLFDKFINPPQTGDCNCI
jgi:hypothetical protein